MLQPILACRIVSYVGTILYLLEGFVNNQCLTITLRFGNLDNFFINETILAALIILLPALHQGIAALKV